MLAPVPAPPAVSDAPDTSIDDLDRAIVTLAARLNAVTHDFLILIRRFDERVGWLGWGFKSARAGCTGVAICP
jgi:hypothetical protein